MVREFDCKIHDARLVEIEHKLDEIANRQDKLSADISDLLAAWSAATWLVSAIKWIGGLATAITAIIILLKMRGS